MKNYILLALACMLGLGGQQATAISYVANAQEAVKTIISGNTLSFLEYVEQLHTNTDARRQFMQQEASYHPNSLLELLIRVPFQGLPDYGRGIEKRQNLGMQASMIYGLMATAALGTGSAVLYQTHKATDAQQGDTTAQEEIKDWKKVIGTVAGGSFTLAGLYALYKAILFM